MIIRIEDETQTNKYNYSEDVDRHWEATPLGYYPRIIDAANSLIELRAKFDEAQRSPNKITEFHEGIYPNAIVLEIDGEPMGVVRVVDDFISWVPFKSEITPK